VSTPALRPIQSATQWVPQAILQW